MNIWGRFKGEGGSFD